MLSSSLLKAGKILSQRNVLALSKVIGAKSASGGGAWNKDWKPGPYPKTQEERDAAARKYGLHPADYEPYPDDGLGYGDYPKLPVVSGDERDPYEQFDFPESARHFGEPMHVDNLIYTPNRVNPNFEMPLGWSMEKHMAFFWFCIASIVGMYILFEQTPLRWQVFKKQMPCDGSKHYTFEADDS